MSCFETRLGGWRRQSFRWLAHDFVLVGLEYLLSEVIWACFGIRACPKSRVLRAWTFGLMESIRYLCISTSPLWGWHRIVGDKVWTSSILWTRCPEDVALLAANLISGIFLLFTRLWHSVWLSYVPVTRTLELLPDRLGWRLARSLMAALFTAFAINIFTSLMALVTFRVTVRSRMAIR